MTNRTPPIGVIAPNQENPVNTIKYRLPLKVIIPIKKLHPAIFTAFVGV